MNYWTCVICVCLVLALLTSMGRATRLEAENAWLHAQIENLNPVSCFAPEAEINATLALR